MTRTRTRTFRLADQRPRHPFRTAMDARVVARAVAADDSDMKLFVLSFTAFFVAIYGFIL